MLINIKYNHVELILITRIELSWYWVHILRWIDIEYISYHMHILYQLLSFPRLLFTLQGKIISSGLLPVSSRSPSLLFPPFSSKYPFFNTDIRVRTLTRHTYLTWCLTRRPVASPSHYPAFNVGRRSNLMRIRRRRRRHSPSSSSRRTKQQLSSYCFPPLACHYSRAKHAAV